ncbi:MAG: inositol monophosphatase, partial [Verrucomicrobiota bacterium]|nr:inositol monophosphatase [Verrucomicrobiota bacterium]
INDHLWKLNSSEDQLTFTYDRSFAAHREFSKILDELELYAQSIGLKGLSSYQYGGAVLNACNALEKSPGCHFKLPKAEDGGGSLWDYAATACLYQESGAIVCDVFGEPLELNRPDSTFMNHRGALYATDANLAQRIREIISTIDLKL